MQVTSEQLKAAERGESVRIDARGKVSRRVHEDTIDDNPWMKEEIDRLADEALDLPSGDRPDRPAEPQFNYGSFCLLDNSRLVNLACDEIHLSDLSEYPIEIPIGVIRSGKTIIEELNFGVDEVVEMSYPKVQVADH